MYVCMFMCDVFQFNVYKSKTDIYIYYKINNLHYVPTTNVSIVHFTRLFLYNTIFKKTLYQIVYSPKTF